MGYRTRATHHDSVRLTALTSQSVRLITTITSYGINNIRSLVGHKVSLESVENSPAVRF